MAFNAGPRISKNTELYVTFQNGLDFYCQGFLCIELQTFACRCRKSDDDPKAAKIWILSIYARLPLYRLTTSRL